MTTEESCQHKASGFDYCKICKIEFDVIGYYPESKFIEMIGKVRFCPVCGYQVENRYS